MTGKKHKGGASGGPITWVHSLMKRAYDFLYTLD